MPSYELTAEMYAIQQGLDKDLFRKQIYQESKFDPKAHNRVSNASGIAQIIPRWHPGVNVWDPVASLAYAAKWMKELLDKYKGDYSKALAAYNWGPGSVDNAIKKSGADWLKNAPKETHDYLAAIMGSDLTSPPTLPGEEDLEGIAGAIKEALNPAAFFEGIGEAFKNIFSSAATGIRDAAIDQHAPMIFLVTGILSLFFGLILSALRSNAAQSAAGVGAHFGGARGRAISAVVRAA